LKFSSEQYCQLPKSQSIDYLIMPAMFCAAQFAPLPGKEIEKAKENRKVRGSAF
jgi:hypothetical protein